MMLHAYSKYPKIKKNILTFRFYQLKTYLNISNEFCCFFFFLVNIFLFVLSIYLKQKKKKNKYRNYKIQFMLSTYPMKIYTTILYININIYLCNK